VNLNKLLLHTCCGPCATAVNRFYEERDFAVVNFFYNPNIHPFDEYVKRLTTLEEYLASTGGVLFAPLPYNPLEYFAVVSPDKRCESCYRLRLQKTAEWAKKWGFLFFATTLTISPYQNRVRLLEIGQEIGSLVGLQFVGEDLCSLFSQSAKKAKERGLYRQNYCGCIYSRWEGVKKRLWKSLTGQGCS